MSAVVFDDSVIGLNKISPGLFFVSWINKCLDRLYVHVVFKRDWRFYVVTSNATIHV